MPLATSINCTFPRFLGHCDSAQGVDIIVRMTEITSHPNDDVVFLQIINSVLMAHWNTHKKRDIGAVHIFIICIVCTMYIHDEYYKYLHFLKTFFKE